LVVLIAIFYFSHRIRRWSKSRKGNVEKEEGYLRQSLHDRPTSLRAVSVFSDTTVDPNEKRGNFRNRLGIMGDAGKGSKVSRGVNTHTLTRSREKTEEGSELVDRLEQLSESQSSPSTSSPSSYHTTSLPLPITSPNYHHGHVNVSLGGRGGGGGNRNQAQAQIVFPSPSHVATRSAGGYALRFNVQALLVSNSPHPTTTGAVYRWKAPFSGLIEEHCCSSLIVCLPSRSLFRYAEAFSSKCFVVDH